MFNSWTVIGINMLISIFISNLFIISITNGVYYDPSDMGKANVKVSEVLKESDTYKPIRYKSDRWIPNNPGPQHFINVMGNKINPNVVSKLGPERDDRAIRRLNIILGDKRDQTWSSFVEPTNLKEKGVFHAKGIESKLVVAADALNITLIDESGVRYTLPDHILGKFRDYLKRSATCTMDYIWEDLGPTFWPQWIRRGICVNNFANSCSWPPGMRCRPSGSRKLYLLYWKCSVDRGNKELKKRKLRQIAREKRRKSKWNSAANRKKRQMQRSRDNSMAARKRRQEKRIKRIIRRTSKVADGIYCRWDRQKYLINDKCSCSCA